ncbi:Olfactory receptor 7A10 [Sciurus carolinensis]|uniref:Olfactory receptor 7A10 n=1 Tax=Sciurus carolinensis TaxID=30640 RepID=A0AA41MWG9_SCICA|nr:Olfactory receptor 7A10 [Sciurus carolinensis]
MYSGNNTSVSEFLLLGFSEDPELQPLIFALFLSMYLVTVLGNLLIILATISASHLHTLSFVDICFTSTTIPKMLLDNFLLAVMVYDRFVTICHSLHYTVIINPQFCGLLVLVCWILSVLHALLQSLMVLRLSFCTHLEISHFFFEFNQVVQIACSDTFLNEVVMYFALVLLATCPLAGILYSYSKIVSSICAISSAQGKYKGFSTCASHLSVVSLFYCKGLGVYLNSAATCSSHSSSTTSVMYTVVSPMLNPFIYSLRNNDVKRVLKSLFGGKI